MLLSVKRQWLIIGIITLLLVVPSSTSLWAQGSVTTYLPLVKTKQRIPEGQALLITKYSGNGRADLYWTAADGGSQYQITYDGRSKRDAVIAPTGEWIAYIQSTATSAVELRFLHPEGGTPIVAGEIQDIVYDTTSWSSDGRYFTYLTHDVGQFEKYSLRVVDTTTFQTHTIADDVVAPDAPYLGYNLKYPVFWLTDGRLAYNSREKVRIVTVDGTSNQPLDLPIPTSLYHVLPDGRLVINEGAYVINVDGSEFEAFPAHGWIISPDGTHGASYAAVKNLVTEEITSFTYPSCDDRASYCGVPELIWSPDGRYIAYIYVQDYGSGSVQDDLYIIKTDGSQTEPTLLPTDKDLRLWNLHPVFSSDSHLLAYQTQSLTHIYTLETATTTDIPMALAQQWRP